MPNKHSTKTKTQYEESNNNHPQKVRNIIGTVVMAVSAIPIAWGFIFWGAVFIIIGIGIFAYGHFRNILLFAFLIISFIIISIKQFYPLLKNKDTLIPIKRKQSQDSTSQKTISRTDTVYKYIPDNSSAKTNKILERQEQINRKATRAYIELEEIRNIKFTNDRTFEAEFVLINTGQTRAVITNYLTYIKYGGTGFYKEDTTYINNALKRTIHTPIPIGAGFEYGIIGVFGTNLSSKDSIDVFTGNKELLVHGIVIYEDVFGDADTLRYERQFFPPDAFRTILK